MSKFISKWFYASLGTYEVEKGLIKKKKEAHYSQRYVNFDEYADALRSIYEEFDEAGYDVVNVTPIQMGQSEASIGETAELISSKKYLGDVGFSITRGAVVIGKQKDD
jgi:glutathione peroxidase-family protein